jgi:hypothetical protein
MTELDILARLDGLLAWGLANQDPICSIFLCRQDSDEFDAAVGCATPAADRSYRGISIGPGAFSYGRTVGAAHSEWRGQRVLLPSRTGELGRVISWG